jgi:small subunit ribosomal protein S16
VAVKIKLKRMGKIRNPQYRIIVADSRTKRDGRAIEEIGLYHPKEEPSLIRVDSDRVQHWLSVGAQPTDPVRAILKVTGDWQKFTGEPGSEGTLRTKEEATAKSDVFAKVLAEAHNREVSAAPKASKAPRAAKATKPAVDDARAAEQVEHVAPDAATTEAPEAPDAATTEAPEAPDAATTDETSQA